jgi:hypothetical protein
MTPAELKKRTQKFALRVFRLVEALPKSYSGKTIAMQLARSGLRLVPTTARHVVADRRRSFGQSWEP